MSKKCNPLILKHDNFAKNSKAYTYQYLNRIGWNHLLTIFYP